MNGAAMIFYTDQERPELAETVQQQQLQDPFRLAPGQVIPAFLVNALISGFFLSAFFSSPKNTFIEYLILLPALFYGFVAVKTITKLMQ